jgi:hypothetical protein
MPAAAAGWPGPVRGPARTQAPAGRRAGRRLAAEFRVDGKLRGLLDWERSESGRVSACVGHRDRPRAGVYQCHGFSESRV